MEYSAAWVFQHPQPSWNSFKWSNFRPSLRNIGTALHLKWYVLEHVMESSAEHSVEFFKFLELFLQRLSKFNGIPSMQLKRYIWTIQLLFILWVLKNSVKSRLQFCVFWKYHNGKYCSEVQMPYNPYILVGIMGVYFQPLVGSCPQLGR